MIDQAAIAADEAVERMRRLQTQVQAQRAENAKQFEQAREQNKQISDKAIEDGKAKRDGRTRPQPAQQLPEERYTFFDQEEEYSAPAPPPPPSFSMPEIPPPPRPTPRRAARPVIDDDEDDYSNQSWLE